MCNVCNMNCCGCAGNWFNTLFGGTTQSICHDCCGNIRVNQWQNSRCGCHSCRHCGCGCGCNGNGTGTTNTDNGNGSNGGRFACYTVCGNFNGFNTPTQTSTVNGDQYYARQYGLCAQTRSSCGCGGYGFNL